MNEAQLPAVTGMPEVFDGGDVVLEGVPERAQQVLCLLACGFSKASIARLMHVTDSAIIKLVNKYDPDKKFTLSTNARRKFIAKLWEARAGEALLHMTPEKMESATISQLAMLARSATDMTNKLNRDEDAEIDPYAIIDALKSLNH